MKPITRSYLELHVAVILFGFTAILGDIITLSALSIVWWRVLITSISLLFLVKVSSLVRNMGKANVLRFAGIGILVALHWLTFYGAIKLSNASITLVCLATTSFFTSFVEPLILRRPFIWVELIIGILVIPGMALIVGATSSDMLLGIVVGLTSALLAAVFGTLNKKYIASHDSKAVTLIELGSATLFLTLALPFLLSSEPLDSFVPDSRDWFYLVILALACTTLAFVLTLRALRHLSAFATALTINLEPVYGIILAWILLQEHKELNATFYWGVLVIVLAVFSYPLLKKFMGQK